ncbi:hypothetical protein [Bifidobacterium callitrichos]|uniref:Transmembrane protein n=1 Tax=Bifidobacterium callitrichos DSM 23973 TaxID=1437609 RepID=A0A087A5V8_9BIFI|nr:hypothetical protein [Bifidobacterium callitrichos]KFI54158.1 hypothetical protein BCAL_2379 [Bifidobacterium callitrichos DSM 23973]
MVRDSGQVPFDMTPVEEPDLADDAGTYGDGGRAASQGPSNNHRVLHRLFSIFFVVAVAVTMMVVMDARHAREGCMAAETEWDQVAADLARYHIGGLTKPAECSEDLALPERSRADEQALRDDIARLQTRLNEAIQAEQAKNQTEETDRPAEPQNVEEEEEEDSTGQAGILSRMGYVKMGASALLIDDPLHPAPNTPARARLQAAYDKAVAAGEAGERDVVLIEELENAYVAYFGERYPGRQPQLREWD